MKKPHGSNCKCNSALEVEVQRLNARVKWIEIIILLYSISIILQLVGRILN